MASYQFRTTSSFGRSGIVELQVNSVEEVELVKTFMVRLAPEIARASLRTDMPPADCAEQALFWAMHLTAKYSQFQREALRSIETQNTPQKEQPPHSGLLGQETKAAADLQQAPQDLPPGAPDLRGVRSRSSHPGSP